LKEGRYNRYFGTNLTKVLMGVAAGLVIGAMTQSSLDTRGGTRAILDRLGGGTDHDLSHLVASHWTTRDIILRLQSSEAPKGSVLLLGDSIIEGVWQDEFRVGKHYCAAVNAGFAGIGVDQLEEHAKAILPGLAPRFVIVAVGINDAWPDADVGHWSQSYERLVDVIEKSGATPILLTINPPEAGYPRVVKSADTVARFNDAIRSIARRRGILVEDVARDLVALRQGETSLHLTIDGIHPTGQFYRELAARWIDGGLKAAEGVRHESCVTVA
jgi:lysophospholipase L1-like esterase